MYYLFKSENIDYNYFKTKNNTNADTIIFLHGWGGNKNSFASTINLLKSKYNILTITMPTIHPTILAWRLEDYANLILNLLNIYKTNNYIIVCHSFGFRVASLLAKQINISKMIVTAGAGLKFINFFKQIEDDNKQIFLKKWPFLYQSIASADYQQLSNTNKTTFKNVVNVNTKNYVKFNFPLLLFWGKKDKDTPIKFAKYILKNNNAKLIKTSSGHFAYLDNNALFNNEVLKFLD